MYSIHWAVCVRLEKSIVKNAFFEVAVTFVALTSIDALKTNFKILGAFLEISNVFVV